MSDYLPSDALVVSFFWLSAEVCKLVELVKWPRYFTCGEIDSTVFQPPAHALWLFDLAMMLCFVVVGLLNFRMLVLIVPGTIAARNDFISELAVLIALAFSSWRSHEVTSTCPFRSRVCFYAH